MAFKKGDLVQLKYEYEMGNPSCFRIKRITRDGKAILGQLSDEHDRYIGLDTEVELDDPDLVAPAPEIIKMYARHVRYLEVASAERGPWRASARYTNWDEAGDGIITLHRKDELVATFTAYRFPIGWRCGAEIDQAPIPGLAKALARRAMNQLP